MIVHYL